MIHRIAAINQGMLQCGRNGRVVFSEQDAHAGA
jgi:hypothetical protein